MFPVSGIIASDGKEMANGVRMAIDEINAGGGLLGRQITYVVPSATAVYNLRREVILGHVPGVAKQSEMHRDPIGHPTTPTAHLVTYVWFAAMYRESPVGLKALIDPADASSAKREKMLQQIAWNAVISEPKSGVKGKLEKVGS